MSDKAHYLDDWLSETLPRLGLDAETYGPYVTGYANEDDDTGYENDEDDSNEEQDDKDDKPKTNR
jgi:hypothetical protein